MDGWHQYDVAAQAELLAQGVSFLLCQKDGQQYAAPLGTPEPEGCAVMVVRAS